GPIPGTRAMKPPLSDERFADLMEALLDDDLDDAGRACLAEELRRSPERRREWLRCLELDHSLSCLRPEREGDGFAAVTAAHVLEVAGEDPSAFSRQVTRRIVSRRRVARAFALAAALALLAVPAVWMAPRGGGS